MVTRRIAAFGYAAMSGQLTYSDHYSEQVDSRPTPTKSDILYMLCDDDPDIIEDYPGDQRGSSCLIWATTSTGLVGHIVCANPPVNKVVTAYFPSQTRPDQWENNFRTRK